MRQAHLHVIGRAAGMGGMGGADRGEVKALRRLRPEKPVARPGGLDRLVPVPQRIEHRQARRGAVMATERVDHLRDRFGAHQRAGRVVDQHRVHPFGSAASPARTEASRVASPGTQVTGQGAAASAAARSPASSG